MATTLGSTGTRALTGANSTSGVTALVVVAVLLTRLPLLGHGYGGDPDAWRAISAARHLVDTGVYVPSRVPGYPLPEYVDAVMLYLGVGSSVGIGVLSTLLSAASAVLFLRLLLPLGRSRAVAGALAMSFTPVVYVAGLGAMDYVWGLTFFLAATSCVQSGRLWWAATFLGLAAASRPTYALAILPLAVLYVHGDVGRLRSAAGWRRLAVLAGWSGAIAVAFFLPAFLAVGVQTPTAYGDWKSLVYNVSVGLFGVVGSLGVACAAVAAWFNRRRGVTLPEPDDRVMNGWALTTVVLFALPFVWLPDEASYLIPALVGVYWLLCRYAPHVVLWILAASLALSCFVFAVDRDHGRVRLSVAGPVLREIEIQAERRCAAGVVTRALAADGDEYVIAGAYRPQLLVEVGLPLADRILYSVRPGDDGRLVDTERVPVPDDARLLLLDRAADQQSEEWSMPTGRASVLTTYPECAGG
ncbi:hypothetical protein H7J06_22975 [Mycobacterium hodleri]|uniref:hypothetical protein n=1 Tax=Mycolicibacterium hodleri TaxID=49897 RepID=UPI0021F38A97|nr:hypothetical protein [Mycolicibacterium hodleri]MCV7135843.1 hypothetical protein [Mycolicibacterium hodleri]